MDKNKNTKKFHSILTKEGDGKLYAVMALTLILFITLVIVFIYAINARRLAVACHFAKPWCYLDWSCPNEVHPDLRCPAQTLKTKMAACLSGNTVVCNQTW